MEHLQLAWEWIMAWIWLVLPLAILQVTLCITALVSIVRKRATGMEKLPWILLVLFFNLFGPIIYFVAGSGYLDAKAAQKEDTPW